MPNFTSDVSLYAPTEPQIEAEDIARRRKLAEEMRRTPIPGGTEVVGGWAIPRSPLEYLSGAVRQGVGAYQEEKLTERQRELARQMRDDRQRTVTDAMAAMQGQPEVPASVATDEFWTPMPPAVPGRQADPWAAYTILAQSQDPMLQRIGLQGALKPPDKPIVVGRSLVDPNTRQVVAVDQTWQQEQEANRKAREAELKLRLDDARLSRQERAQAQRELAEFQAQTRADMLRLGASMRAPTPPQPLVAVMGDDGKPVLVPREQAIGRTPYSPRADQANAAKLPATALKMQQEELDAIQTASQIDADLGAVKKQISEGKLSLGPLENVRARVQNMMGASDEKTRNFASFQATLERLRNESLRLNKGVQTEGDAQRAWNELIQNINDPKVVAQRLDEIQRLNKRAVTARKMNVDVIRSNFGVPPMEVSGFANQPAAVGGGGLSQDEQRELEALRARFKK